MKYVYCLVRDVAMGSDAFPSGLNDAEVYHISFDGISALVSDMNSTGEAPTANERNVLAHQEVVDAALRLSRSIIPCRFGTLFPNDSRCQQIWVKRAIELSVKL